MHIAGLETSFYAGVAISAVSQDAAISWARTFSLTNAGSDGLLSGLAGASDQLGLPSKRCLVDAGCIMQILTICVAGLDGDRYCFSSNRSYGRPY